MKDFLMLENTDCSSEDSQYNVKQSKQQDRSRSIKIGDLFWVDFGYDDRSKHSIRPAVIFQNNLGNVFSPNVKVLPLSTKLKRLDLPTHVFVPRGTGSIKKDGIVCCESPACISKEKLMEKIGHLPDEYIQRIAEAEVLATGSLSFLSPAQLITVWERSRELNSRADLVNSVV